MEADGAPAPATEATTLTAALLDAVQAWAQAQRGEVLDAVLAYTSATQNRGSVPSYTVYFPFTVLEDTLARGLAASWRGVLAGAGRRRPAGAPVAGHPPRPRCSSAGSAASWVASTAPG